MINIKRIVQQRFLLSCLLLLLFQQVSAQNEQGTGYPYFVNFTQGLQPQEAYKVVTSGVQNDATFTTEGLRLTRNVNYISGGVILADRIFKSDQGIKFEFEYAIYGGGAERGDGISIFLVDGSIPKEQLNLGYFGGGLGYTHMRGWYTDNGNGLTLPPKEGLRGAYLGIGLDLFGNFKSTFGTPQRKRNGLFSTPPPVFQGKEFRNNVTLRGKRGNQNISEDEPAGFNGYPLLYSVATNAASSYANRTIYLDVNTGKHIGQKNTTLQQFTVDSGGDHVPENQEDPEFRKAFITLVPNPSGGYNVTVEIQHGKTRETVIDNYYYPTSLKYTENTFDPVFNYYTGQWEYYNEVRTLETAPPPTFRIGFAASTAGARDIHLLKNLGVSKPYAAEVTDDLFAGCPNIRSVYSPLLNDAAYTQKNGQNPPTASYDNIDFKSFRFLDINGNVIPNIVNWTYTNNDGTWIYDPTTGKLSFKPASGFTGVAQIRYDIKGGGRDGTEAPYNQEDYRSMPALVQVNISSSKNCSKACVISNKNVTQKLKTE